MRLLFKILPLLFLPLMIACTTVTVIPKYNMSNFNHDINAIYKNPNSHSTSLTRRLITDSQYLMDKPYLLGALGEGEHATFDKSPLYRTDAFDCTTFVSTVLALVNSNNLTEFQKNILKIRYKDANPSFVNRNHFISVDWNSNNQKNGYLKDINKKIIDATGHSVAVRITTLIDRPNWYRHLPMSTIKLFHDVSKRESETLLEKLHHVSTDVTAQKSQMYYLPINKLFVNGEPNQFLFNQIPSGVVIEVICQDNNLATLIGTNLTVSHMGIGIRINNRLIFREASTVDQRVRDMPLESYLEQFLHNSNVKGVRLEKMHNKYRRL
jgi:hypothetical protein